MSQPTPAPLTVSSPPAAHQGLSVPSDSCIPCSNQFSPSHAGASSSSSSPAASASPAAEPEAGSNAAAAAAAVGQLSDSGMLPPGYENQPWLSDSALNAIAPDGPSDGPSEDEAEAEPEDGNVDAAAAAAAAGGEGTAGGGDGSGDDGGAAEGAAAAAEGEACAGADAAALCGTPVVQGQHRQHSLLLLKTSGCKSPDMLLQAPRGLLKDGMVCCAANMGIT